MNNQKFMMGQNNRIILERILHLLKENHRRTHHWDQTSCEQRQGKTDKRERNKILQITTIQ
jgi:hypothetical protein